MKKIEEMTVAELRKFAADHNYVDLTKTMSDLETAYLNDIVKNMDFKIDPDLVALATGASRKQIVEERRMRKMIEKLILSTPKEVTQEIEKVMGNYGVELFKDRLEKLFISILKLPERIKADVDVNVDVTTTVVDKVSMPQREETSFFNFFEGTPPIPESEAEKFDKIKRTMETYRSSEFVGGE